MSAGFRGGGYDENGELHTGTAKGMDTENVSVTLTREEWRMLSGPIYDALRLLERKFPNTASRFHGITEKVRAQTKENGK